MNASSLSGRQFKASLRESLLHETLDAALSEILQMPPRKVVNPLISFLCSSEPLLYWRSISAIGAVVAMTASHDLESARVIMRRLMWQLNEESGGIGWGCPEAMGEIMARCDQMAKEYACILVSFINPDGSFIEHPILQQGVLWGLGRLAHVRPERVASASAFLTPLLSDANPVTRGLSAWVVAALPGSATKPLLIRLSDDNELIPFYINGSFCSRTISSLTR